ncbi:MAG: protein jag [Chloroflexi bacterium]|nr:protein jag [Chloroflexota bacterium]
MEEAVELALRQLDAKREEVEIEVLSRGRPGFLGIGAEPARVRAVVLPATETQARSAKEAVDQFLAALGVKAIATIGKPAPDAPDVSLIDIEGEDAGLLIGRRGETLRALQFLVNLVMARRTEGKGQVVVDVEHYKQRRQQALRELALRVADRVAAGGRSITLEPMPASERRIIHLTLAQHPRVSTQSVGDGDARKVTVFPRRASPRPGEVARPSPAGEQPAPPPATPEEPPPPA